MTTVLLNDAAQLAVDEEGTAPCTKLYGEKENGIIPIDAKGFGNGHFFTKITSDWVGLRNKKDGSLVKVNCKGYPYVMVWQGGKGEEGAAGNGFNCIEPWYGTADAENTEHEWEEKSGLISLEPGKSFTADQSSVYEKQLAFTAAQSSSGSRYITLNSVSVYCYKRRVCIIRI